MTQRNYPVDVISVCSADGQIQPLRLRLEDENRQMLRLDIQQVVKMQEIHHVGVEAQIFLCAATVAGENWLFELKYTIRSHKWCLLRRIC